MAAISHHGLRCMAGITFLSAMLAVPKIPQRTLSVIFLRTFHTEAQRKEGDHKEELPTLCLA
jgi:hypothetical protein